MITPLVTAVYDANLLYPAPLRDLFMRLAHAGLVRARWTDMIHDEWIRSVLRDNQATSLARLLRTKTLMNQAVRDCLVTGYEELIPALTLPDPNDRHVLAAAIHCQAEAIVTFNLKDFPTAYLASFGISPVHLDNFLTELIVTQPGTVCAALKRQREALRNPPFTAKELLDTLAAQGLVQSVYQLRPFQDLL